VSAIPQRPKALTKLLVKDPDDPRSVADTLHRVQDHLLSQLNPILRSPITSTKPTVTGSKGGNAALASLIAALVSLGLITDKTT
jgi:hypothetical protein